MKKLGLTLIISAILGGCATYRTEYTISSTKIENQIDSIESSITPNCITFEGCKSFYLDVKNKSDKTLEINWNKTLFIVGDQSSGGFMFEGILYKDRNAQKSPDVVFPNSSFSKTIWPTNLVEFSSGRYDSGWRHGSMPTGDIGVYLTVTIDGKDFSQKMTNNVNIKQVRVSK